MIGVVVVVSAPDTHQRRAPSNMCFMSDSSERASLCAWGVLQRVVTVVTLPCWDGVCSAVPGVGCDGAANSGANARAGHGSYFCLVVC